MAENIERFNPYCGCTENMSECNTVVKRVAEVPSLRDATRNHVYLLPNNTAWIVNSDGTGFSQLNNSVTAETYDDTDLKERLEELESKPDNDTKYSLALDTKVLLRPTPIKTLIESHTGTDQPLLGTPNIVGDFISYSVTTGKVTFKLKLGDISYDFIMDKYSDSKYDALSIGIKNVLKTTKTHFMTTKNNNPEEVGIFYEYNFDYVANSYVIDYQISVRGIQIPIHLDLVALKEQFEANPNDPVKTLNYELYTGDTVELQVIFDENFYIDTVASVVSRGRYKLNEL